MDPEQQVLSVNKPSGIPRASKLPVLRSKTSQVSLQGPVEPSNTTNAPSRTRKPPSVGSFSRPGQPASKTQPATGKQLNSRNDLPNGSYLGSKFSSTTGSRMPRLKSTGCAKHKALPPQSGNAANVEGQENHEALASLDSFRATSRQGPHDGLLVGTEERGETADLANSSSTTRSSRPSLSDRTMESIQRLPSTPKERRRSTFFSPVESPMRPPPRPGSSLSGSGSNVSSRPTTSNGDLANPTGRPSSIAKKAPASAQSATKSYKSGLESTSSIPHRRSVSNNFTSRDQSNRNVVSQSQTPSLSSTPAVSPATSAVQRNPRSTAVSKTLAARPSRPRPRLSEASGSAVREASHQSSRNAGPSSSSKTTSPSDLPNIAANSSKSSSAALREQIAAAKAAARKERAKHDSPHSVSATSEGHLEVELHADPFNLAPKDEKHILRNRINAARMDGKLNIAALGLKDIPTEVLMMYDAAAMEESKVNWAEVVDLTRLIVADNEIEGIGDAVFPDKSVEEFDMDDQAAGNQFGGLEMLDLHGNRLQALPLGLRRLERLTSLNLSHNKLDNSVLDVISQIPSIKDLRLGHNALSGGLPTSTANLKHLERLELQSNRLLGLPEALRELVALKILDMSSNQLTTVPMEALQELPLTELNVSSNALIAALFPLGGKSGHPTLQTLNVANNSLASLTFDGVLDLPQLRTLDITNNHLTRLPPMSGMPEMITLTAGDNKIGELPADFSSLRKLRNVNLSSNALRLIEPQIAYMESLESLILASNPLRDKKFLTMNAADIKRDLRARLVPSETNEATSLELETPSNDEAVVSPTLSSTSASWTLQANGVLDLSGRGYSDNINDSLGSFLRSNEVKQLLLQSNKLNAVPPALWLGQDLRVLELSNNALSADYLYDDIELPSLQDLSLSRCGLQSLEPLITQLRAPNLRTLNLSVNRLSGALSTLRTFYPLLTTLWANDNRLTSVTADSLHGFHVVNLANNNIGQLPAEIGLLWDDGLRSLEIGGNAFRMPNHRILEKGTEATMLWLRDRLPESQDKL